MCYPLRSTQLLRVRTVLVRSPLRSHESGAPIAALSCAQVLVLENMIDQSLLDDLGRRIAQAVRDGPGQDMEKNLRALLSAFFDRFDLVAREDFDVQRKIVERAQAKLEALEARVSELESRRVGPPAR